jgi:hypothetical protein
MSFSMLTLIIDHLCGPLAERIEQGRMPHRIRVNPEAFEAIAAIRARETADGQPLLLLGLELEPSASIAPDDFRFAD